MTNFIYNMQDELFHLPLEDFSTIKKLVDHIEAQGKQLRELNAAITKSNKTIEKYEREKKELQKNNSYLINKVNELNAGIRNSEDLTWKQKYDALQNKCQEYKNEKLKKNVNSMYGVASRTKDYSISFLENHIKTLEEDKKVIEKNFAYEMQVNKDLNVIINSKNKLLDEYMTKRDNLERKYAVLRGKLVSIGELANKIDDVILSEE